VERMGQVISLKPGAVTEYNRLHAAVWPEVLQVIHDANIRNYSIFLKEPENHFIRLLEISWDRFRRGRGGDARPPRHEALVGGLHAAPGGARNSEAGRMVGDDAASLLHGSVGVIQPARGAHTERVRYSDGG
jgi:hypothetical protein